MLPVVHWLPQRYHQRILRALGREFWAQTDNLNLLSSSGLQSMFPDDATVKMDSLRTFGWPSNLMAYAVRS